MSDFRRKLAEFFDAENRRDWDNYQEFLHPQVEWVLEEDVIKGRERYCETILLGSALFAATSPAMAVDAAQDAGAQDAAQATGAGDAQADVALDWKAGPQHVGSLEVELVSDSRQVMPGETFPCRR